MDICMHKSNNLSLAIMLNMIIRLKFWYRTDRWRITLHISHSKEKFNTMIVVKNDKSKSYNIYYQLRILSIQLSISRAH